MAHSIKKLTGGEVVLLVDDCATRNSWIMEKVINSVPDKKGLVCSVCIKTKTNILDRPIMKICLLMESEQNNGKDRSTTMSHVLVTSVSLSLSLPISLYPFGEWTCQVD